MLPADLQPLLPQGRTQLLVQAAFHSDPAASLAAWRAWEADAEGPEATWTDFRLAAATGRRLAELGVETPLARRLAGYRRFFWSNFQLKVKAARPLLHALGPERAPLLLKGVARVADHPRAATERMVADIDLLIRPDGWDAAIERAYALGYRPVWPLDRDLITRRWHTRHHSIPFAAGRHEVDLHQFSLGLDRFEGADDGLWQRSRDGVLAGAPVRLPHPCDLLATTLGHAFTYVPTPSFDWIADSVACLSMLDFDWPLFADIAIERALAVPAVLGLAYLRDTLAAPVAAQALEAFAPHLREPFLAEVKADAAPYGERDRTAHRALFAAACERARRSERRREDTARVAAGVSDWSAASWRAERDDAACTIRIPEAAAQAGRLRLEIVVLPDEAIDGQGLRIALTTFDLVKLIALERVLPASRPRDPIRIRVDIDGALVRARKLDRLRFGIALDPCASRPPPQIRENAVHRWHWESDPPDATKT